MDTPIVRTACIADERGALFCARRVERGWTWTKMIGGNRLLDDGSPLTGLPRSALIVFIRVHRR